MGRKEGRKEAREERQVARSKEEGEARSSLQPSAHRPVLLLSRMKDAQRRGWSVAAQCTRRRKGG